MPCSTTRRAEDLGAGDAGSAAHCAAMQGPRLARCRQSVRSALLSDAPHKPSIPSCIPSPPRQKLKKLIKAHQQHKEEADGRPAPAAAVTATSAGAARAAAPGRAPTGCAGTPSATRQGRRLQPCCQPGPIFLCAALFPLPCIIAACRRHWRVIRGGRGSSQRQPRQRARGSGSSSAGWHGWRHRSRWGPCSKRRRSGGARRGEGWLGL